MRLLQRHYCVGCSRRVNAVESISNRRGGELLGHSFFPELETHLREVSNCKYKNKLGHVWRRCKKTCLKMSFDNTLHHSITLCNALRHTAKL